VLAVNGPRAVKVHRKVAAVVADPPQSGPGQDADAFPAEYLADQLAHHIQARVGEASGDELPTHTEPDHDHVGINSHYRPFHCGK
jgi:hypothetical protein